MLKRTIELKDDELVQFERKRREEMDLMRLEIEERSSRRLVR